MSDCSCSIEYEADCDPEDYATYYKARVVTSFTEKTCCECGAKIPVGDTYRLAIACWKETKWERYHSCADCYSVRKHIFCVAPYDGGIWEELSNYLDDCDIDDMPIGCLSYLTPKARKCVCEMIEDRWNEIDWENDDA